MTGPEDILEAFRRHWEKTQLPSLVSGGLHYGQAPQTREGAQVAFPYATVTVADGEVLYSSASAETSAGAVILTFTVEVKVYVSSDSPNTDSRKIRQEIDKHFNRDRAREIAITPATILDWRAVSGEGLMLDPKRHEAQDVAILTRRWEVTVQGVV